MVGERLAELREQKALTLHDLEELSGVGADGISKIENGHRKPRPSTLRKLARALGVEVEDFFRVPAVPLAEAPRETGRPEEEWSPRVQQWLEDHGARRILMTDEQVIASFDRMASGSNRQAIPDRFEQEWHKAAEEQDAVTTALTSEWVNQGALFQEAVEGLKGFERASARMKEYTRLKREISRQYGRYRRGVAAFSESLFYSGEADDFIFTSRSPEAAEATRAAIRALQKEALEEKQGA